MLRSAPGRAFRGLAWRAADPGPSLPHKHVMGPALRSGVPDDASHRRENAAARSGQVVMSSSRKALTSEAHALGFDCVGVADPAAIAAAGRHFRAFLELGAHGEMDWLAARPERRADPRVLWPGVRSVIMLGVNYGPDQDRWRSCRSAQAARSRSMRRATIITI